MSFTPGQLSTIEGRGGPTKSFDLADLPCPPASVSEADWYNYQSGEPYNPVIAAPPELYLLDPSFAGCVVIDVLNGYDPPYALTPVAVLATTTDLSTKPPMTFTAQPQPTTTSGPSQTAFGNTASIFNPIPASKQDPGPPNSADPDTVAVPISSKFTGSSIKSPAGHTSLSDSFMNELNSQTTRTKPAMYPSNIETPSVPVLTTAPSSLLSITSALILVNGHTISPLASPILTGTDTIAYSAGSIYVGNTALPVPTLLASVVIGTLTFFPVPTSLVTPLGSQYISTFVVGGETATELPSEAGFVVAGQTLVVNTPVVTVSGTEYSLTPFSSNIDPQSYALLPSDGSSVTSLPIPVSAAALTMTMASGLITLAVISSTAEDGYLVDGNTLVPGKVETFNSIPVSVAPGGSDVVVRTSTIQLGKLITAVTTTSTEQGMGGVIISAFNGFGSQSTSAGAATSATGSGSGTKLIIPSEGSAPTVVQSSWSWRLGITILGSLIYSSLGSPL
ncbi:hypothetical protein MMC18_009415 [Xylographa bjoerkii]|nr:hypothetical protein [Xylographa bjoerkii]